MISPEEKRERALEQLRKDAEAWREAEQAHEAATETRNENIRRAVKDGLSLRTVGDAYGVTRQYVGQIVS